MERALYREMAALEDRHWWFVARRDVVASVLDRLVLPADAAVLEVGCGAGGNLPLLARYGRLYACEPDPEMATFAAGRGVGTVAPGALPDALPFGDQRFDVIALLDVLEHVADDRAALLALRERLTPGGTLLLTVPAYAWLWSGHDVANHHRRRYHRSGLVGRLTEAGFAVWKASYFNTILFPAVVMARLAGKVMGRSGDDLAMPTRAVNGVLRRIFSAERHVVPRVALPFGVSLLAVANVAAGGA